MSKGLEINIIAIITIGIVGIAVLLAFLYGPLSTMIKTTFCYFYENLLKQKSEMCKTTTIIAPEVTICETKSERCDHAAEDVKEIVEYLAAYSILCWRETDVKITNNTICYQIFLETHPGDVNETFFTYVMEKERGCEVLQNSKVVLPDGTTVKYPGNCGTEDNLVWDVSGNVIKDQTLILIKYDMKLRKIVISA
jgi:hypothetical protein